MSAVSIVYDLGRHGWSNFKLTVGDDTVRIGPFGYCTDALGDLVRAALMMATFGYSAEVCFDGEGREWRLVMDEGWKPKLRLRVYDNLKSHEATGDIIFENTVTADDFARAVKKVAEHIWNTYGSVGYNEAWIGQRGFPLRALRALDAALSEKEPPPAR